MKRVIHLQGDRDEIALGVKEMAGHLKFSLSEDSGIPLTAIRTERQDNSLTADTSIGRSNDYYRIVTAGVFFMI